MTSLCQQQESKIRAEDTVYYSINYWQNLPKE